LNPQQKAFWETIKILSDVNILDKFIIIGSWVEYLYEIAYLVDYKSYLKTMDADLLIKNINLFKKNKFNLPSLFENHGFVYFEEPLTGITKFFKAGIFEVEFLVRELGKGHLEPYKIDGLGIKVEGLRHMEILCNYTTWINANNYSICVPIPQAYIIHKLVINDKRGAKKEKDLRAVKNLLLTLQISEEEILKLKIVYAGLFKSEKKKVEKVCIENAIDLFGCY